MKSLFRFTSLLCCLHPFSSAGQFDSLFNKFTFLKTKYDTAYIHDVPKNWEIFVYSQYKNNSFDWSDHTEKQTIFFDPLTNTSIGAGGSYQNFSLSYGFAVSTNQSDSSDASGIDFITSLYVGQHIFDFGFRYYRGYYVSGYDSLSDQLLNIYRDDIATANLFVNYLYNFNYERFSLNASFIGSQIQRKSAGAPLAGLLFNYNDLHANTSIVPPQFDSIHHELLPVSEANIWTFGVLAGYAYTFVLPLHFYLTLSIIPGYALNFGEAKTDEYFRIGAPATGSFKLISKNAFGYSGERIYGYVSISTDKDWIRLNKDDRYTNNLGKWRIQIGYLFN